MIFRRTETGSQLTPRTAIQQRTAAMKTTLFVVLPLIALTACDAPRVDLAADREQIAQNVAAWQELGKTGDTEKILTYFADDVMIFPAGQPVLMGRDAVRKVVEDRTGPRRTTT